MHFLKKKCDIDGKHLQEFKSFQRRCAYRFSFDPYYKRVGLRNVRIV